MTISSADSPLISIYPDARRVAGWKHFVLIRHQLGGSMRKPRLMLSLAALGSSLLLAAALALPASGAIRTGSSSGQLVAAGAVTAAAGQAMAGAKVSLYAWPSSAVLVGLHPGQSVPRKLLATTTADSQGRFSFRVSAAALASSAVSGGNANLEADSGTATWFFVQKATGTAPATTVSLTDAAPDVCTGWTFIRQLRQRWGTVGQSYDPHATHVKQSFTYSAGQSSSISIGVTYADGSTYHFGGKESTSTKSGEGFPSVTKPSNNLYRTHFKTAKYKDVCATTGGGITYHMVRSNAWAGGEQLQHPAHAPTYNVHNDCQPYPGSPAHPSTFYTQNATAITWTKSEGLTVEEVSFDLSIETGYSSSAKVTYKITANRQVCGSNNAPTLAQRTIAVK